MHLHKARDSVCKSHQIKFNVGAFWQMQFRDEDYGALNRYPVGENYKTR